VVRTIFQNLKRPVPSRYRARIANRPARD
jgi:hypothetical protein